MVQNFAKLSSMASTVSSDADFIRVAGEDRKASFSGPLLDAVIRVERANADVLRSSNLRDWSKRLAALAVERGRIVLYGASTVGDELVGAMVVTDPRLEVWRPGDERPVLVVDGWVTSMAGVVLVAHRLAALGAPNSESVVIGIDSPAGLSQEVLSHLSVLES
jgi:hypothetical protein